MLSDHQLAQLSPVFDRAASRTADALRDWDTDRAWVTRSGFERLRYGDALGLASGADGCEMVVLDTHGELDGQLLFHFGFASDEGARLDLGETANIAASAYLNAMLEEWGSVTSDERCFLPSPPGVVTGDPLIAAHGALGGQGDPDWSVVHLCRWSTVVSLLYVPSHLALRFLDRVASQR